MHLFLINLSNHRYQFFFILCFTELSSVECHRSEDCHVILAPPTVHLLPIFVVVLYTENMMVVKRRDLIIEHLIIHFTIYVRNT